MTRKRFVKLLMAQGYSRNAANFCAAAVVADGGSYREEWQCIEEGHREFEAIVQPPAKLREAVERFGNAIVEGIGAFVRAFGAALE